MPYLVKGIPDMDVPAIDPLHFSSIKVETGNTGSANLNIDLLNGTVTGLRNLKIENLKTNFGDDIRFTTNLIVPEANIEGTYKMKGNLLLFELNGEGHMSLNATDIRTDSVWIGTNYLKKDKKHIKLDKIHFNEVQIKTIRVKFENLFGPNTEPLTNTANNAINENIDNLRAELEPIIKETLVHIISEYFNRVYRLFPMDQLYPVN
ncbi:hypothetical protein ILUMI_19690 [Ignelater luminosus]|uniref:Uncharacterized protein n=1 Tax=Ignelater luminosus TaxID=2038154 RepID=A0A8K0G5L7_IGNLU|nr:hypothetical protein ILUMI_19690 [Ignelater luminosus]